MSDESFQKMSEILGNIFMYFSLTLVLACVSKAYIRMYRNCHKIYMPPILMTEVFCTLQKFKLLNSSSLSQNWEEKNISNENNYAYVFHNWYSMEHFINSNTA